MPPRTLPLTDQERSTLLRFEAVYEQWRVAREALSASERRLWFESFHAPDGEERRTLGVETVRLRTATREAYASLISLLERSD
ncbi:MAG: hypothetical protein ACJ8GO_00280 [Ramlibacter sp.]